MSEHFTSGLVVVGAGGAGLPAALVAQEKGVLDVVVLEKRPTVGGNAGMSGGFLFAAASGPQRERGTAHSPDVLFRETMAHYRYDEVDARLIRLWVDEADRNVEWMESIGVGYRPWFGEDPVVEPTGWSNHPGSFQQAMEIMRDRCIEQGGRVLTRTPATAIEPGDRPGWHRVRAQGPNGEVVIDTPRVLLASGGFTGNVELLHEKFPGVYDEAVYWTDTKRLAGDGIPLAAQAGGDISGRTFLIKENCYSFKTKKNKPNRGAMEPTLLWVNQRGERFLDESTGGVNSSTNALVAQPGMLGFALFDDAAAQRVMDRPNPFADELRPGEEDPNTWTADGFRRSFREDLAAPENSEWCMSADSWAEVAEWIGADPATLEATVAEYNRYCEQGRDELWGKPAEFLIPLTKPPFSALKFRPLMIDTVGPVQVDTHLRVLGQDGKPVPGLYAAGALTSGWVGADEHRFGTPLSWAIGSGRVAGASAVDDVAAL
jgi:fumarate reductase flavoprotein subunit